LGARGWTNDVRVLPILLKCVKDRKAEVARGWRSKELRRMEWECVAAFDESALELMALESASETNGALAIAAPAQLQERCGE